VDLLLGAAREWLDERTGRPAPAAGDGGREVVDVHGFTHVRGPR
jgi:hypothetical protein